MGKKYPIIFGDSIVGDAEVIRQGLYYIICCKCKLSGDVLCRVSVCCGKIKENLSILVPKQDVFVSKSRVPVGRLGVGELQFYLTPKHTPVDEHYIPLRPKEPFAYLAMLDQIYLRRRDQQYIVVFKDGCC